MQSVILNTLILNCLPIFGIVFLDWQSADLILLYGIETLFIMIFGIISICRLPVESPASSILKAAGILFFLCHFGVFSIVVLIISLAFYYAADIQAEPLLLWLAFAALVWHQVREMEQHGDKHHPASKIFTMGFSPWFRIIGFIIGLIATIVIASECDGLQCKFHYDTSTATKEETQNINDILMLTLLTLKITNDLVSDVFRHRRKPSDTQPA
ncbi:hypothetical protein GCM10023116_40840 [Kistimonas scapharcae]|uniref:Uncharacterized protein n=1 Tax=Kistimonas scapharcae TaxID=1036133 RepID=A0ABP8V9W0_9GAMM